MSPTKAKTALVIVGMQDGFASCMPKAVVDGMVRPIVLSDCVASSDGRAFVAMALATLRRNIGEGNVIGSVGAFGSVPTHLPGTQHDA